MLGLYLSLSLSSTSSNHVLTMDGPSALKVACGALQGALLDKQGTISRPIPVLGSFLTTGCVRTTEDL